MDIKKVIKHINNIIYETEELCDKIVDDCDSCPLNVDNICIDEYLREVVIDLRKKLLDE